MATINTNTDKLSSENIKYILVTGGVMSGVGKGVIASSLATLLQLCGIEVTSIKIDPYINVDCGTMSPFEHEVVLKAKWKGLRDNFRVEYKRIPRLENGEFRVDPATFESKWIHYYALLFLTEHMRHRAPKNEQDQSFYFTQQSQECEKTIVEPDLTNGLIRRMQDSDEDFDDDDDIEQDEIEMHQYKVNEYTPPAAHTQPVTTSSIANCGAIIKTEDARNFLKNIEKEVQDLSKKTTDSSKQILSTVNCNNIENDNNKYMSSVTVGNTTTGTLTAFVTPVTNVTMSFPSLASISSSSALATTTTDFIGNGDTVTSCRTISPVAILPMSSLKPYQTTKPDPPVISNAAATAFVTATLASLASNNNNNNVQKQIEMHHNTTSLASPLQLQSIATLPPALPSAMVLPNACMVNATSQKIRSVSPPPLYNKAHHPPPTTSSILSKERADDFPLNTSICLYSNSNHHEHLNFTKHSYSNGLINALKLKRSRLSEDSNYNGSSTMDTTTISTPPLVPEDDDYHYLLSLHPYMKQLTAAQKLRIRTKIQKLIFKELYKEDLEESEVYVLDDGSEVDLDLGNYERFLDVNLHADNSITTGKIYQLVIQKERRGDYLGKTVQVVPHLTNAIEEWVERVAQKPVRDNKKPQICIIELGGTIGDIEGMPFVEAFRTFQNRKKSQNFCLAHVSPVPFWSGEHKTKPTQGSVRILRSLDLKPDLIFCRSAEEKKEGKSLIIEAKEKISHFCNVPLEQIVWVNNVSSIYRVPLLLEEHGIIKFLNERFQLNIEPNVRERCLQKWKQLARRSEMLRKEVSIALVGKYTKLKDSYASVIKALEHASLQVGYKLKLNFIDSSLLENETLRSTPSEYHKEWQLLCESDGVVVPGGFGARGMEGKINACEWCRKNRKPFLGICLGLQAAVIEFARNVLNLSEANTTEIDKNTPHPIITDMEGHCTGEYGGTMRLGKHTTTFSKDVNSIMKQLYGNAATIEERHRHRYEVNLDYKNKIESEGLHFVGTGDNGTRMEIIELDNHPYYVGTQYHPEFLSRPMKPSPPFLGLILASVKSLDKYIAGGCQLSPWPMGDTSSYDDDDGHLLVSSNINGVNVYPFKHYKQTNGTMPTTNGKITSLHSQLDGQTNDVHC